MQNTTQALILMLMNIFIVLTLTNYLLAKLFGIGIGKNTLCCGLFGGQAVPGKKLSLRKLAILGLYNLQRGTDSCGYYYNGNVVKGIGDNSNFGMFITNNKLLAGELDCEVFIGHTRKSTSGTNTEENAHPHVVEDYVQSHNGVLRNHWELCTKNGILHTNIHVDSIALAHVIKKQGWKTLEEYKGHAALAMTYTSDPKNLYLFHGASKEYVSATVFEERPLFVLETAEGIYYSSMKESLELINESKKKVEIVPHNEVFRVYEGRIVESVYSVKREDANCYVYTNPKPAVVKELPFFSTTIKGANLKGAETNRNTINITDNEGDVSYSKILTETVPLEKNLQDVYFWRSRHYKGENILLHGAYKIDRAGKIVKKDSDSKKVVNDYYFFRGVMLHDLQMYNMLKHDHPNLENETSSNIAYYLSKYSKYPVVNIDGEANLVFGPHRRRWYLSLQPTTAEYSPAFSKRIYVIKSGLFDGIKPAFEGEPLFHKTDDVTSYIDITEDATKNKTAISAIAKASETSEPLTFSEIVYDNIREWAHRTLTKDMLMQIPETLLIVMDMVNSKYMPNNVTDKELEDETTLVLKDLFKTGKSYYEHLVEQVDQDCLLKVYIDKCFKDFAEDEVLAMESRYEFIDFDEDDEETVYENDNPFVAEQILSSKEIIESTDITTLVDKTKENYVKLQNQLEQLITLADDMQGVDTDFSQDTCFSLHKQVSDLKKVIGSLQKKYPQYKDLIKTIEKIK